MAFAADLHMSHQIWSGRPDIVGDAEYALAQMVWLCQGQGIRHLVLGGDVTDTRLGRKNEVRTLHNWLGKLSVGTTVSFIAGNHDPDSWVDITPAIADRMHHLDGNFIKIGDHEVYGLDYRGRTDFQAALADIPEECSVLVCHQRFHEAFSMITAHAEMGDLPDHVKLVLAGDIHIPFHSQLVESGETIRHLVYPGCPYLRKTNDPERHGLWLFDKDMNGWYHNLDTRTILRLSITSYDDIVEVVEEAKKAKTAAMVRIPEQFKSLWTPIVLVKFYDDDLPEAHDKIRRAVGDYAHVFAMPSQHVSERLADKIRDESITKASAGTMQEFLSAELDRASSPHLYDALDGFLGGTPIDVAASAFGKSLDVDDQQLKDLGLPV